MDTLRVVADIYQHNHKHMNIIHIDKQAIVELYQSKKLSIPKMSKILGVGTKTIKRNMKNHGIKLRTRSENALLHNMRGTSHPAFKTGNFLRVCKCGNRKDKHAKVCINCYNKSKYGEGNPNYKGISDITNLVRQHSVDYWRPKIFERDNFTCQECGKKDVRLEAHHINPLSTTIKSYCDKHPHNTSDEKLKLISTLITSSEVNDISNGVTLCKKCHKLKHYS
jgi:hypothetical protein